jgi:hypothetical protein
LRDLAKLYEIDKSYYSTDDSSENSDNGSFDYLKKIETSLTLNWHEKENRLKLTIKK